MERRGRKTILKTTILKNEYEILSPFFLKYVGFCVSLYLYALCLQLFIMNPGNVNSGSFFTWEMNSHYIWAIISGAFIMCVLFSAFIFMKINHSKVYLFSMYFLYIIMCILFLFVLKTNAKTDFKASAIYNANILLKIALCLGYLFIFLEFLHAQTSNTFIRDKCILAGIMGMAPCIAIFVMIPLINNNNFHIFTFCLLGVIYAIRSFVFSLRGKYDNVSMLFKCKFAAFLILWALLTNPNYIGGARMNIPFWNPFTLIILVVFGCTQLIPLECKKSATAIIDLFQNPKENGVYMLVIRFIYFAFLAEAIATIWRG